MAIAVLLGSLPAWPLHAENVTIQLIDMLRGLKVAPATGAVAARQGFVLSNLQMGAEGVARQAGDQVTALVSLSSFDRKLQATQWIIRLRLAGMPGPNPPKDPARDLVEYTNSGDSFTFHSETSRMDLETLGPIPGNSGPGTHMEVKRREIFVRTDFLCLDLTGAARFIHKLDGLPAGINVNVGPSPFPAVDVQNGRKQLAGSKLTQEEFRSFAGSLPALGQFLDIVRSTPDLQGILFQVLDKPSLIDVFGHGSSRSIHFAFLGAAKMDGRNLFEGVDDPAEFYRVAFNIEIFEKPAVAVVLYVMPPAPPLEVSAGVVGIVAFSPSTPDKVVVVRVLSSVPGGSPDSGVSSGR